MSYFQKLKLFQKFCNQKLLFTSLKLLNEEKKVMAHELHFVVGKSMHCELVRLSKVYKKSISKTMVLILDSLDPFLEKNQLTDRDNESRYSKICEENKSRHHVHCYISKEQLRKLKFVYQSLNLYSIGQVIRKLIKYFIMSNLKYGFEMLTKKLDKVRNIWKKMKENYAKEKKVFVRHLSNDPNEFIVKYNKHFIPSSIFLIE